MEASAKKPFSDMTRNWKLNDNKNTRKGYRLYFGELKNGKVQKKTGSNRSSTMDWS